jgi:DNA-binding transcriptional LysR family regulator
MAIIHAGDVTMNLRSIDLNLLPVFEAVYAERSLTRAGETLHVTQPAVSNALARLRAAFGDPLFVRSGRGMTPTPAAQALIGPVREAMAKLRAGLDARSGFEPKTSDRVFNIAVRDVSASALMPGLAKHLQRVAPGVRLHCHQVERRDIPIELAAGRLDFAIDIPALARPDLDSVALMSDPLVCALRRGHPGAGRRLTLQNFLELGHIAVSSRRAGRTMVDEALSRIGEKLRPVMRLPHYQPAFHVVMASDLALVAPLSSARRYGVTIRDLPFPAARLEVLLFWRRETAEEPAIRWMRDELIRAAQTDAAASGERGGRKVRGRARGRPRR